MEFYVNDFGTTLAGGINSSQTTLTVQSGVSFPSSGNFRIRIDGELMTVTAVSGSTWTVTRGAEGTTANAHLNGAVVNSYVTAGALDGIRADIHQFGTTGSLPVSSGHVGDSYFSTDDGRLFFWNGSAWLAFGVPNIPSYLNPGGLGYRVGGITTSVGGGVSWNSSTDALVVNIGAQIGFFNNGTIANTWFLRWDFAQKFIITEARWNQQNTTNEGTWQWQGTNNLASFTNLGSQFTIAATQVIVPFTGNTTAYRYYQMLGVSGTTNSSPWIYGTEFKISFVQA